MEEARSKKYDQIAGFIQHELPGDEQQELEEWLNERESNRRLFDEIIKEGNIINGLRTCDEARQDVEIIEQRVLQAYYNKISSVTPRFTWRLPIGIAASVILAVS